MDVKNFVGLLVFGVIGIIVLAAFVPIISETTSATNTLTNDGYTRMAEKDTETVITWTPSIDRNTIMINDVEYSLLDFPITWNTTYSIAFSDDFVLRVYMDGVGPRFIQIWQSGSRAGADYSLTTTATFTITPDAITYNSGEEGATTSTYSLNGSSYFVMDSDGPWIMKDKTKSAYILSDSTIVYAGGISYLGNNANMGLYFTGTLDNYTFTPMDSTVTISNPTSTYTSVAGYIDVVSLSNIQFDTTTTSDVTQHQTYSYFLVPYEITAEKSVHPDTALASVIDLLPLVAGIGLFIILVGEFLYRRYL